MLNHIVMWKIKEDVEDKEKVKLDIKNGLEGLFGKIKELREIRVETFMETTSTHDIALFVKVICNWSHIFLCQSQAYFFHLYRLT